MRKMVYMCVLIQNVQDVVPELNTKLKIKDKMKNEEQNLNEPQDSALNISDVIRCLSPEIEQIHYQSRDRNLCYLQSLLTEAKSKGNLVMELL